MHCKRCRKPLLYSEGEKVILFHITHTVLCEPCINEWEIFVRSQPFWERHLFLESEHLATGMQLANAAVTAEERRELHNYFNTCYERLDKNKREARPVIAAWLQSGGEAK